MVITMKTVFKKLLLTCTCLIMLVALCACDSGIISTEMALDEAFSGTREISFEIKKADLGGIFGGLFGAPTVDSIVETLEKSCPPELTMEVTKKNNDAKCTFTLAFANKADYEQKAASLAGKAVEVQYEGPSEDLFISGITLSENFTSSELMLWAGEALAAEYPKYADKVAMSDEKGETVVMFDGAKYASDSQIDIKPFFTPLDRVIVKTERYGENDFIRTVEIHISAGNLAAIGKDKLTEKFLMPLSESVRDISTAGWVEGDEYYVISMVQGGLEELSRFTEAVFKGSTVAYDADSQSGAFTESGTLNENFKFDGFVCDESKKANVTLIYTTNDETKFTDGGDAVLSADGKKITIAMDSCTEKAVKVISETRYIVEMIGVTTNLSPSGKMTVAVMLDFPAQSSRSASELAEKYFSKELEGTGVEVSVKSTGIVENNGAAVISKIEDVTSGADAASALSGSQKFALVFSASGKPEEITKAFANAFGENNFVSVEKSGLLQLYRTSAVTHSVDVSEIASLAQYSGNIKYSFSGSMTKIQNVGWNNVDGLSNQNVLGGEVRSETFTAEDISCAPFTITYQYRQLNIVFILGALILGIGAVCLLIFISNIFSRKLQARRGRKKKDTAIEAVKCVALAALPEDKQGELAELPPELTQRPMVVLEPRNDDGLDDDDDEPEGVQIFATTLRLLTLVVGILFFFPFCNIQRTGLNILDRVESFTGWNIFTGGNIFGVEVEPYRFIIVLLAIPVLTLLLLMCRKMLPKLIVPIFVTAASIFSVFYLIQLPDVITKMIDAMKSGVADYVTDPAFQMGYTYSIVIYVLLAIGGVLLLFSELSTMLSQRRKEKDK